MNKELPSRKRRQQSIRWMMGSTMLLAKTIEEQLHPHSIWPLDKDLQKEARAMRLELTKFYLKLSKRMNHL